MMTSKFLTRSLRSLLFVWVMLVQPSWATASDPFQDNLDQGTAHYQRGEYEEAIKKMRFAFALRPMPRILLNIGSAYRKLGNPKESLAAYELYLQLEPNPKPAVKTELDKGMALARTMLAAAERARQDLAKAGDGAPRAPSSEKTPEVVTAKPIKSPDLATANPAKGTLPVAAERKIEVAPSLAVPVSPVSPARRNLTLRRETNITQQTITALWGSSVSDVWAVGLKGTALHYDGRTWKSLPVPSTNHLFSVWGSGPSNVWAVGDGGTIIHFDGRAWSLASSGTERPLYGVHGNGPGASWIVGEKGTILAHIGGKWSLVPSGTRKRLNAVWAIDSANAWAVGEDGTILSFLGAGWSPVNVVVEADLQCIYGRRPSDVWVGGANGTLLHFEGQAWLPVAIDPQFSSVGIFGIDAGDAQDIWIIGTQGTVARRQGQVWSKLPTGSAIRLTSLVRLGDGTGWLSGIGGHLFRIE